MHAQMTECNAKKSDKLIEYLTGDSVRLDENVVEAELASIGALIQNEIVKLAYKCGRDSVICTSKRMLYLDCQGISGKETFFIIVLFQT